MFVHLGDYANSEGFTWNIVGFMTPEKGYTWWYLTFSNKGNGSTWYNIKLALLSIFVKYFGWPYYGEKNEKQSCQPKHIICKVYFNI